MTNPLRIHLACAALITAAAMTITFTGCESVQKQSDGSSMMPFSGGSTNYVGETLTLGGLVPGSATCLSGYCTYLLFNNAGAGFSLPCTPAYITIKVNGEVLSTSQYEVQWRYSATKKGCVPNFSSTQKQYANVVGKKYTFTVYFREPCPQPGSSVEIIIECTSGIAATQELQLK